MQLAVHRFASFANITLDQEMNGKPTGQLLFLLPFITRQTSWLWFLLILEYSAKPFGNFVHFPTAVPTEHLQNQNELATDWLRGALFCTSKQAHFKRTSAIRNHHLITKRKSELYLSICTLTLKEVHTHKHRKIKSEIFNVLAKVLSASANRPLKEMSSQLPEVCPFDKDLWTCNQEPENLLCLPLHKQPTSKTAIRLTQY